jgi:O-antigen/teichoic acid export membrane protein
VAAGDTAKATRADALAAVALRATGAGFAALNLVLFARLLRPEEFGAYVLATSVLLLLALLSVLGLDALGQRVLAVHRQDEHDAGVAGFLRWSQRTALAAGLVAAAATLLWLRWNPLGWTQAQVWATVPLALAAPLLAAVRLNRSRLQAAHRAGQGVFFEQTAINAALVAAGVLLWLAPGLRRAAVVSTMHAGIIALSLVASGLAVRRFYPAKAPAEHLHDPGWLRSGAYFFAASVLWFAVSQGDVLVAGSFLEPTQAGQYSLAARLVNMAFVVLFPLQQALAPRLAQAWARQDSATVVGLGRQGGRASLVLVVCVLAGAFLPTSLFAAVFGGAYAAAVWPLRIMAIGLLFYGLAGTSNMVLQMVGLEKHAAWVLLAAALASFAGMAVGSRWGMDGIAAGKALGFTVAGLASYAVLRARTGLDLLPVRLSARP